MFSYGFLFSILLPIVFLTFPFSEQNTEPPTFTVKPDSQNVIPGSKVTLKSVFTGTAPFTIKWFKGDNEISTGGTCFIKKDAFSSLLELHSVKPKDSDNYTCQVANDAGKETCTAVLFVKGAFSSPIPFASASLLSLVNVFMCWTLNNHYKNYSSRTPSVCEET